MAPKSSASRYPDRGFTRPALAPALIAAVVLMAGAALISSHWFLYIRFAVAILVAIMGVFAVQGKKYAWLVVVIPVVIAWNPIFPFPVGGTGWLIAHLIVPIALVVAGVKITVPTSHSAKGQ